MSNVYEGPLASGLYPMPEPRGSEVLCVRGEAVIAANPVANDVSSVLELPAGCVPVDMILDAPDMDTNGSPTIAISAGVLNAAETDLDAVWISASTVAQAGGVVRPTLNVLARTAPAATTKKLGLKFTAIAATFAAGSIGFTLFYRAAYQGK